MLRESAKYTQATKGKGEGGDLNWSLNKLTKDTCKTSSCRGAAQDGVSNSSRYKQRMANPSVETFSRTSRDSDARQRSGNSQARSFRDDVVSLPAARAVGRMPRSNRSRCAWTPARQDQNSHPQWGRKTRGGRSKPTPSPARQGRKALPRRHFWSRMWHARAPGKLTQFIVSRDR